MSATPAPRLRSQPPRVRLTKSFDRPFDNAVATARTCYSSKGIIADDQVAGTPERIERRDALARDIYDAGHHTTLQHAHFQFSLENVSRQFIWSFLHSHPFYNSEQVSQRYVEVKPGNYLIPQLEGEALSVYETAVTQAEASYHELIELLTPVVASHFWSRFPGRRHAPQKWAKEIRKKAQELARYVLPVATFAYLYHTISGITLLRYNRIAASFDVPTETKIVVDSMVEQLLATAPEYQAVLEAQMALEDTPEYLAMAESANSTGYSQAFVDEFDRSLGSRTSLLVDFSAASERTVASAVREVLGVPTSGLSDHDALNLVLDPARNRYMGETLTLSTHSKLMRTLFHAHYVFRKKLSHSADSQDQRHRMTPASRPLLTTHIGADPDFILPELIRENDRVLAVYQLAMERAWAAIARLRAFGVSDESALYLLPNATSIRFTESADLLNLQHKLAMRLCWNAQEEIWRASKEEAEQVVANHPLLGRWLLPPCSLRERAGVRPICPEGTRYCGVTVWRLPLADHQRTL